MPSDQLEDIGGGVSVFMPAGAPTTRADNGDQEARFEAFHQLSEEIARVSSGDPLSISPRDAEPDPNLEFFLQNKTAA